MKKEILTLITAGILTATNPISAETVYLKDGSKINNVSLIENTTHFNSIRGFFEVDNGRIDSFDVSNPEHGNDILYLKDGSKLTNLERIGDIFTFETPSLGRTIVNETDVSSIVFGEQTPCETQEKISRTINYDPELYEAFGLDGEVWIRNNDDTPIKITTKSERRHIPEAKLSPDGQYIAFVERTNLRGGQWNKKKYTEKKLCISDLEGNTITAYNLRNDPYRTSFVWNPDGTKLAFSAYAKGTKNREVFTIRHNGSDLERLTFRERDDTVRSWDSEGLHYGQQELHFSKTITINPE